MTNGLDDPTHALAGLRIGARRCSGLDDLSLEYVYQEADGTPHRLNAPLLEDGAPASESTISGTPVTLARVQMTVAATERASGNREIGRSYTGQVEMSSNPSFKISKVVDCA